MGITTGNGGTSGWGTVFKLTPSGAVTVLYSFCSQSGCPDGSVPNGLIQASNGDLYGTTGGGGTNGLGTVFRITLGGALTRLHSFCSQSFCPDGSHPSDALVQGSDGDLYGTTAAGGTVADDGTVFKITLSGALTTLYSFCQPGSCTDGAYPSDALIQAADGNFYGTTTTGGTSDAGTIFELTPGGSLTTLHNFCGKHDCADGSYPQAALTQDQRRAAASFRARIMALKIDRVNVEDDFEIDPEDVC